MGDGKLQGRVTVVTGGGSGIGREISLLFARHGAPVAILDVNDEGAGEVVAEIAGGGGSAVSRHCDVSRQAEVVEAALQAQFVPQGANISNFGLVLGSIHILEGMLWFTVLILATRSFTRWLRQPEITRRLDQLTGGVLILFGLKLALEPSHAR